MLRSNTTVKQWLAVAGAFGLASAPIAAQAYSFTPDGAANWITIARTLTYAVDSGNERQHICDGMNAFAATHAWFVHEVTTTRDWASRTHLFTCTALADNGSHKGAKCKAYRQALGEVRKATPGIDPPEVAVAATMLRDSITSMLAELDAADLC
jgi:hypothetical protein